MTVTPTSQYGPYVQTPDAPANSFLDDAYKAVGGIAGIVGIVGELVYTDQEKAQDAIKLAQAQAAVKPTPAPTDNNLLFMIGGGVLIVGLLGFTLFKLSK
jgi:hypothetical protein